MSLRGFSKTEFRRVSLGLGEAFIPQMNRESLAWAAKSGPGLLAA